MKQDENITDKFLELINTPNTTDTWVVLEMIKYLGLQIKDDTYAKWFKPNDSSSTTEKST